MIDSLSSNKRALEPERCSVAPTVKSEPLVSIVLIFFNASKFLDEAIQSVFAQLYNCWELLLVDDGSVDTSTQLAHRYAERFPKRVRYLEHPGHVNRGMSASRNLGIRHARGEYIGLLDADDVWLPNKLQCQTSILSRYPEAGMVVGPVQWWYSWSGNSEDRGRDFVSSFPPEVLPDSLAPPPKLLVALLQKATVSTTAALLRREIVNRVGGFEEDFPGMFEDQVFAAKIYLTAPVFVAGDCHYKWRKHPESCCAVAVESGRYAHARFEFLCWLKRYLSQRKIKSAELDCVIEDELHKSSQQKEPSAPGTSMKSSGRIKALARYAARRLFPASVQDRLRDWQASSVCPPVRLRRGIKRRLTPISRVWGFDRGLPIDRYYIEGFLAVHAADIHGHVLEIANDNYTHKFGGDRVLRSDVLYPTKDNPRATIVADLTRAEDVPSDAFDCIICTQTLMFIFEIHKAMHTLYRVLKPAGVLLMTLAGVSQISVDDMDRWGDYWRFTSLSARRVCETVFPPGNVTVETHGNVLAAAAFLHGLAREELRPEQLDAEDPDYEVLIGVRAVKPATRG